ncbi:MAG: PCRF domain-containing protein, partial [Paracoccaceae bacterium]
MVPFDRLEQIAQRFEFLEAQMNAGAAGDEIARLAREYSELKPVVEQIVEYKTLLSDMDEAKAMLSDPDMRELAEDELPRLKACIPEVEHA